MEKIEYISQLLQEISYRQILKKLKNRRFWRDSGLLILANFIVTLLGLIRTPAMTWLLPKEEYGMIATVTAWMPFLQLLSLSGLDNASYHYSAKGKFWAFVISTKNRLIWSIFSSLGFFTISIFWFIKNNSILGWLFLITGFFYPVTIGLSGIPGMLSAQEKFYRLFWYRILESICDFAGFIPLAFSAWLGSRVITFYSTNQIVAAGMQIIYCYWIYLSLVKEKTPSLSCNDEKELIRYGKHQTAISGISVIQSKIDAVLVSMLLLPSIMADYNIGLIVADQFKRLWNIYISVRYPPLVKMELVHRRRRFILEGIAVTFSFFGFGMLVSKLGHFIIPILLPPSYFNSLVYLDILIGSVIIGTPGGVVEIYYRTKQDEKTQYAMRITSAIVSIIASLAFILIWNAKGAAYGRFFANLVFSLLGIYLFLIRK